MKFKDTQHEEAFNSFIERAKVRPGDVERISLFYLLSIFAETRNNINTLYDFKENWIKPEGLNQGWQTGGTTKVTKLAYNLYNGFNGEEYGRFDPLSIFSVSEEYREYMLYAVRLRFA